MDTPLHQAIIDNNFQWFKTLLNNPDTDINAQNGHGETPLYLCIANYRPLKFIQPLLHIGCDVTICDKRGMTPLWLATIKRHCDATMALEKYKASTISANQHKIRKFVLHAIKNNKWEFYTVYMNGGKTILICSTSKSVHSTKLNIHETNVFLDLIMSHRMISKEAIYYVIKELICHSLRHPTATLFKSLWNKIPHYLIQESWPSFLNTYHSLCSFKNFEYSECLCLILRCKNAFRFFEQSDTHSPSLYDILRALFHRNVEFHDRIPVILCALAIANPTICEIRYAYRLYGFNEEVVIFLKFYKVSSTFLQYRRTHQLHSALHFIGDLDRDPTLTVNKIGDLELIPKKCYRKLINIVPDQVFSNGRYDSIRIKKEIANITPTLYEISRYHFQKFIQNFYKIEKSEEFCEIVNNLTLPWVIKNNLCKNPPLYY